MERSITAHIENGYELRRFVVSGYRTYAVMVDSSKFNFNKGGE